MLHWGYTIIQAQYPQLVGICIISARTRDSGALHCIAYNKHPWTRRVPLTYPYL